MLKLTLTHSFDSFAAQENCQDWTSMRDKRTTRPEQFSMNLNISTKGTNEGKTYIGNIF